MQMHLAAPTTDVNISELAHLAYLRNPVFKQVRIRKTRIIPLINLFLKINRDVRLLTQ